VAQEQNKKEVERLLASFQTLITYVPLRTEVPFTEHILLHKAPQYAVPPRAALDPIQEATKVKNFVATITTALLIPGRAFDASGTRHGQGGGWYDRFLTYVPREWVRIGFCFDDQFSSTPLPRQSWDQVMDYVVVVGHTDGSVQLYANDAGN
jgi:5,10-methenyltetrahydrofolate synthetase